MPPTLAHRAPALALPPTWHTVDVGRRARVTLAARRPVAGAAFTPNLALAVTVEPAAVPVMRLADRELGRLAGSVRRARLVAERRWDAGFSQRVVRTVRVLTHPADGDGGRDVLQWLVHAGGPVEPAASARPYPGAEHLVAFLVLSCEPSQQPVVGAEFEAIINSLRLPVGEPRRDEGAAWTRT